MTDPDPVLETLIGGLRRYARALLGDSTDVDELVQESLMRAWSQSKRHGFGAVQNKRAYLFAILHNVFIDYTRAHRRRVLGQAMIRADIECSAPPLQDAWLGIGDLLRMLRQVPTEQRRVLMLAGIEGHSYQDVARMLDIPLGTVMSRLSRGRDALRRLLSADDLVLAPPAIRRSEQAVSSVA